MGQDLLTIIPGALLRAVIPVVAIVVLAVMAKGRARGLGITGFAVVALGTLASGLFYPFLPVVLRSSGLSVGVLTTVVSLIFTVINALGLALIVMAIVVGSRAGGLGVSMPQRPQGPEFRNDR